MKATYLLVAAALMQAAGLHCSAAERTAQQAAFRDPLDMPAQPSALAARAALQGAARAGQRLVAVGQRGHIVLSDDGGAQWRQARVPVSSDLTAVRFASATHGWAVGHDGVVLHTADGGQTWALQLDGRRANQQMVDYLEARLRDQPARAELKPLLDEARRNLELGADKPFLDLWFADTRNGFVVGAYNLVFRTTDGGATWTPWFDRTDNPKLLNLYAIAAVGPEVYVVGEAGLVLKLDAGAQRFRALLTPYKGSFFGVLGTGDTVLAYGLRGSAWASDDGGTRWRAVDASLPATLVAAATLADGRVLLADAGGRLAVGEGGARHFRRLPAAQAVPLAGLAEAGPGRLLLTGPRGATVVPLTAP